MTEANKELDEWRAQKRREAWEAVEFGINQLARLRVVYECPDWSRFVMVLSQLVERIDPQATYEGAMFALEAEFVLHAQGCSTRQAPQRGHG